MPRRKVLFFWGLFLQKIEEKGQKEMKLVFSYLKPYRWNMVKGLLIKIIGTFADLGLPWILAYILNEIIPLGEIIKILLWGIAMLALAVLARNFNIIANRMAAKVAKDAVQKMRHDLFQKINTLSGTQTDTFTIPSLISRMTSDSYNIHQMIGMMQRLGVRAPLILLGGVTLTFFLEPVLTLVLIAIIPVLAAAIFMISRKGIPIYGKVQQASDHMIQVLRENISGIRVVKALSKTEYEKRRFAQKNKKVIKKEFQAGSTMAVSNPCMNLLLNLGLTFVIVVGAYRVNSGKTPPGTITAFLSYFTMILNSVLSLNRIFIVFSKASASAERIKQVLTAPKDLALLDVQEKKPETPPLIEFNNVSFSYSRSKEFLMLKQISFQIEKGSGLGIIGATGSGKSTLVHLLMRFYDVTEGSILIDGCDIRSIPLQELRSKFGVVFQNDMIFMDSIQENISFGRNISKIGIRSAAKDACADGFIMEKEGGYEYRAAIKGADFSGGQKQRLLIARALAGNPPILILDDSSSALDYKTDAAIRKAITQHYPKATLLLIAQRISSVMHMDQILVLEDGKMIGLGTHEQLLKTCEVYREIYDSQIGIDQKGADNGSQPNKSNQSRTTECF